MSEHTNGQIEVLCTKFYLKDVLRLRHINPKLIFGRLFIVWLKPLPKSSDGLPMIENNSVSWLKFYCLVFFKVDMVFLCTVSSI